MHISFIKLYVNKNNKDHKHFFKTFLLIKYTQVYSNEDHFCQQNLIVTRLRSYLNDYMELKKSC